MVNGKYYTFKEAMSILQLGRDGITALIEKGYLTAFKDKSRRYLIPKESIDKYLEDCLQEAEG